MIRSSSRDAPRTKSTTTLLRLVGLGGRAIFGALVGAILGKAMAALLGVLLGLVGGKVYPFLIPTGPDAPQLADDPTLMAAFFLGMVGWTLGAAAGAISGAATIATGRLELGLAGAMLSIGLLYRVLFSDPEFGIVVASITAGGGIVTALGLYVAAEVVGRIWPEKPRPTESIPMPLIDTARDGPA